MRLALVGLNHRTAPVEVRERLAACGDALQRALQDRLVRPTRGRLEEETLTRPPPFQGEGGGRGSLRQVQGRLFGDLRTGGGEGAGADLLEAAVLSTCNRLEVYAVSATSVSPRLAIEETLGGLGALQPSELVAHLFVKEETEAADHLMRVAAGLDSMILGESEILGQVADVLAGARDARTIGPVLTRLFTQAVRAGKRARTETAISRHTTSVSHAAIRIARDSVPNLTSANILVVGAGHMALQVVAAAQMAGATQVVCINRTLARAEAVAQPLGFRALALRQIPEALVWCDVAIAATGAQHTVIDLDDVAAILPQRAGRPLVFVDIAVPRDVDPRVAELPDVRCFDIDDLESVLDESLAQRIAAVPQVESIVLKESQAFASWRSSRSVAPAISQLRVWADSVAQSETKRALDRLPNLGAAERDVVRMLAHRLVSKLIHGPTTRLRDEAVRGDAGICERMVREMFALEGSHTDMPASNPPGARALGVAAQVDASA